MSRAVELGGTEAMDPIELPSGATLAAIEDPEAHAITLVQQ
jgi:predicted enzyme related to lactoylglutathione lyase